MRSNRRPIAALAAVGLAFVLTPVASAQQDDAPRFKFDREIYGADYGVFVTIEHCPGGQDGPITSPGFAAPIPAGETDGKVGSTFGTFTATLKCKGTPKVGTATFQVQRDTRPRREVKMLDKFEYAPGETVKVDAYSYNCGRKITSEGFAAPIDLREVPGYRQAGEGKAVDEPGTYEALIGCKYELMVHRFTVKAPPTTQPPKPPTNQPPANPGPKPKIVKPKGAPQTGGGGTTR